MPYSKKLLIFSIIRLGSEYLNTTIIAKNNNEKYDKKVKNLVFTIVIFLSFNL